MTGPAQAPARWLLALAALVVLGAALAPAALAQAPGGLTGRVLDGETGETIPGAAVRLPDMGAGAATDVDGVYRITGVPAGTYSVTVSFLGYAEKTVTGVEVPVGETATLDVTLDPATAELDEVVVTAEEEGGSAAEMLNFRLTAANVLDIVDAKDISTAGSSASAAIERVSGAQVTDGGNVQVRGFGGRYGKITVNGVSVPSTSPDESSVSLDVISSDVLESASVAKGWTPDLPADFVGGLVDLRTVRTPAGPRLSVGVETEVNSATTFQEGLVIGGCDDAWTGFSNCYAWPESVASLPDSVGVTGEIVYSSPQARAHYAALDSAQVRQIAGDILTMMPVGPSVRELPMGQDYEVSAGDRYRVGGRPFGVLGVASYSNGYQQFGDYVFNSITNDPVFGGVRQTDQDVRVGGLGGLSYEPSSTDRVSATLFYNRLTEDRALYQAGLYDPFGEQQTARTVTNQRVVTSLFSGQLAGEHRALGMLGVRWTAAYSRSRRLEPGTMTVQYQGPQLNEDVDVDRFTLPDTLVLTASVDRKLSAPQRYHFDQADRSVLGRLDLTLPLRPAGRRLDVKAGGYADLGGRVQDGHRVVFGVQGDDGDLLPDLVFSRENVAGDFDPNATLTEPGVYIDEVTQEADNYEATNDVVAGYALVDADALPGLRVIAGLRVERSDQRVEIIPKYYGGAIPESELGGGRSYTTTRSTTDLLPGLSAQAAVTGTMDVRASYGRTLARPRYFEFVEFQYQPRPGASAISGNPDLERTVVDNLDLRYSWYPTPTALLSVGGFYKYFDGPIEPVGNLNGRFQNTGRAYTYGVEGEVRLPLALVSRSLQEVAVRSNLALLQTRAGAYYYVNVTPVGVESVVIPEGNRALFGQTPVLFNLGLTYEPGRTGTSATVLFRYTGEQLRFLNDRGLRTFREPLTTLDVVLSQSLGRGLTLDVKARNLLGSAVRYLRDSGPQSEVVVENGVVRRVPIPGSGVLTTNEGYDQGRTVKVGLSWSLN